MSRCVIRLVGWERFQHYKNRSPSWVKFHRDMLTSEAWVLGTDTSRLLQCASILLAARYNNAIPHNYAVIQRVAGFSFNEKAFDAALAFLSQHQFLEIQEDAPCASTTLAPCYQDASTALELEEKRREEKSNGASAPPFDPSGISGLNLKAWALWVDHRKAIKKPLKPHSLPLAAKQLAALGASQLAEVERAVAGGWQGLHPAASAKPKADPYANAI